jgi:hypothetical protein
VLVRTIQLNAAVTLAVHALLWTVLRNAGWGVGVKGSGGTALSEMVWWQLP